MTSPTPVAQSAPTVDGVNITSPNAGLPPGALGGTTTKSQFGLQQPSQIVNAGRLTTLLQNVGVVLPSSTPTAEQLMSAIVSLQNKGDAGHQLISTLQTMLQLAGDYKSSKPNAPGILGDTDIAALANNLNAQTKIAAGTIAQAPTSANPATVLTQSSNDVFSSLSSDAQTTQTQGLQATLQNRANAVATAIGTFNQSEASNPTTTEYNKSTFFSTADNVAQSLIGRFLTTAEKNQLYDTYGVKSDANVTKDEARATKLNALQSQTEQANAAVSIESSPTGDTRALLSNPSLNDKADKADTQGSISQSLNLNTFLDSVASTSADPNNNPYGFTPQTWSLYAQQAGLGADAPQTALNEQLVARNVTMSTVAQYGSYGAAIAAMRLGPAAAAAYARNPSDPRFTAADATGTSVTGAVNAAFAAAPQDTPTTQTGLDPSFGNALQVGNSTVPSVTALGNIAATDAQGNAQATVTPTTSTINPLSPDTIVEQGIKDGTASPELAKEYQAHNIANTFNSFLSLLGGVGSGSSSGSTIGSSS